MMLDWIKNKIQNFKIWLSNFILKYRMQYHRGKEITEQMRAEKLRKKQNRIWDVKPSWKTDIRLGLATNSSPFDVMKKSMERRKYERENK